MIISHRHRFIFFAVPKTATHTIRKALRPHLDEGDWEQQQLFGKQVLPIPELARIGHGHISAKKLRPHLEADVWQSYFKFGFVRNPFDRFVSTCFFLHRNNAQFKEAATTNMKQAFKNPRFRQRILVRPQAAQLTDNAGQLQLDFTGRYETLQASFDKVCKQLSIPMQSLGHENASRHGDYLDYYDAELRQSVAEYYADDLQLFGYQFPDT